MSEKSHLDAEGEGKGRRPGGSNFANRLVWFLVGTGFGAAIALLFAPQSGEELRNDIADATRKGIDRSREAGQLGLKVRDYYEEGAKKAQAADLGGDETKKGY